MYMYMFLSVLQQLAASLCVMLRAHTFQAAMAGAACLGAGADFPPGNR